MSDFKLGEHEEAIRALQIDVAQIATDVREIREIVAEKRGERHAVTIGFGAVGGTAMTLLLRLVAAKFGAHP